MTPGGRRRERRRAASRRAAMSRRKPLVSYFHDDTISQFYYGQVRCRDAPRAFRAAPVRPMRLVAHAIVCHWHARATARQRKYRPRRRTIQ